MLKYARLLDMTTGRRAGASTAKADILEAARELFAEVGFDRATIRAIAARANVDVALVSYYYENKAGLLRAAMELPWTRASSFSRPYRGRGRTWGSGCYAGRSAPGRVLRRAPACAPRCGPRRSTRSGTTAPLVNSSAAR
ncbi:hypothetical protein MTP03_03510 [Tsukamurella sp. PLM1]|nr:hypothetical protein MTP03_03510 [Tsukamurella sp. PLM1]